MGLNTPRRFVIREKTEPSREELLLKQVQAGLLPADEKRIVAIGLSSGNFVIGDSLGEVTEAYRQKYPDEGLYVVRADGSPVMRVPWA